MKLTKYKRLVRTRLPDVIKQDIQHCTRLVIDGMYISFVRNPFSCCLGVRWHCLAPVQKLMSVRIDVEIPNLRLK